MCKKVKTVYLIRATVFLKAVTVQLYSPCECHLLKVCNAKLAQVHASVTSHWKYVIFFPLILFFEHVQRLYSTPCTTYQEQSMLTKEIIPAVAPKLKGFVRCSLCQVSVVEIPLYSSKNIQVRTTSFIYPLVYSFKKCLSTYYIQNIGLEM